MLEQIKISLIKTLLTTFFFTQLHASSCPHTQLPPAHSKPIKQLLKSTAQSRFAFAHATTTDPKSFEIPKLIISDADSSVEPGEEENASAKKRIAEESDEDEDNLCEAIKACRSGGWQPQPRYQTAAERCIESLDKISKDLSQAIEKKQVKEVNFKLCAEKISKLENEYTQLPAENQTQKKEWHEKYNRYSEKLYTLFIERCTLHTAKINSYLKKITVEDIIPHLPNKRIEMFTFSLKKAQKSLKDVQSKMDMENIQDTQAFKRCYAWPLLKEEAESLKKLFTERNIASFIKCARSHDQQSRAKLAQGLMRMFCGLKRITHLRMMDITNTVLFDRIPQALQLIQAFAEISTLHDDLDKTFGAESAEFLAIRKQCMEFYDKNKHSLTQKKQSIQAESAAAKK